MNIHKILTILIKNAPISITFIDIHKMFLIFDFLLMYVIEVDRHENWT